MRLAVLLCMPAWCHGEAAHAKAEAESLSRTLSGFQRYTDSLVEEYKNNAKSTAHLMVPADPAMADTIRQIIEFIDGFFGTAKPLHYMDVGDAEKCSANTCFLDKCSFGATHTTQVIQNEMAQVQTALTAIRTCLADNSKRIQEHSVGCTAWDTFRTGAPPLPTCVYNSNTGSEDFCNNNGEKASSGDKGDFCDNRIKADENDDEEELEAMEDCLEETHLWMTSMWEVFQNCNPRDDTVDENNLPCQEKVTEYHRDHCEYTMVVSDDCKKYDMCVDGCDGNCNSTCGDIEIRKNARMADNETGERIKCLLAALVDEVGDNVTNTNATEETKTAKQDALAACINDAAKEKYATLALFFEITCASTVNEKVYPAGVNCEHRDQPVSCSIDYMDTLVNSFEDGVPGLKDYDASDSNTASRNQLWNSCECGHKCQGSGRTDTARADGYERSSTDGHNYTNEQGSQSYTDLPKCRNGIVIADSYGPSSYGPSSYGPSYNLGR